MTLQITALSHDGRGIAKIDGKTIFVENALVGEEVEVRYLKRHAKYDEAVTTEIIKESPLRQKALCEHFGVCAGCSLQHLTTEEQLSLKQKVLLEHLKYIAGIDAPNFELMTALSVVDQKYRSKARLSVKYLPKKEKFLLGFHEYGGRFVADIQNCPILRIKEENFFPKLRSLLLSLSIFTQIPQIELAITDDVTALIIRHLEEFTAEDLQKIKQYANETNYEIYLQSGDSASIKYFAPREMAFPLFYRLPQYGLQIFFEPNSFTQVNQFVNEKMVDRALALLDLQKDDVVLDLFCGIGNFTLPIAQKVNSVFGVEGSEKAVQLANKNKEFNQISNASFFTYDLMQPVSFSENDPSWQHNRYSKVLLDPPRSGAIEILESLASLPNLKKIVYVSCNPPTLARDIKRLGELNFKLEKIGIINMFPHTKHVETVCCLYR